MEPEPPQRLSTRLRPSRGGRAGSAGGSLQGQLAAPGGAHEAGAGARCGEGGEG